MNNEKFDIFVSYAHEDKGFVGEVVQKLSSTGLRVWIDKEIHHGESISSRIVKAIERATFVLFFSSKSSNASDYCVGEILVAVQKRKCIIPIKIDSSDYCDDLLVHLIRIHYVNFIDGFSIEEYDELVSVLSGGFQMEVTTIKMKDENSQKQVYSKKTYLYVVICVILGTCGVGIMTYFHNIAEKKDNIEYSEINGNVRLSEEKTEKLRKIGTFYSTSGYNEASITVIVPDYELEIFVNDYRKKGVVINVHEGNRCSCRGKSSLINEIEHKVNNEWTGYTIIKHTN